MTEPDERDDAAGSPTSVGRREALKALGAAPLAAAIDWRDAVDKFTRVRAPVAPGEEVADGAPPKPYVRKFFTAREWATVRVLVDLIIPRDDRSGSATDARVPEFMDTLLADESVGDRSWRVAMRGGIAWMDRECDRRHRTSFVACTHAQRSALLDDIAFPAKARKDLSQGAAFFSSFRDLTASGFWSSPMGVKDLQYIGNVFNPGWSGCPEPALRKLGVSYDRPKGE